MILNELAKSLNPFGETKHGSSFSQLCNLPVQPLLVYKRSLVLLPTLAEERRLPKLFLDKSLTSLHILAYLP